MTEKLQFEFGQHWVTRGGDTVRILSTEGMGDKPVIGEYHSGLLNRWSPKGHFSSRESEHDLVARANETVTVSYALYRQIQGDPRVQQLVYMPEGRDGYYQVSDPETVTFKLFSGETL